MPIYVGVCKFTKKMYSLFQTVEIQRTFYNIPKIETVEKWRLEAPNNFIFSFKVFQGLTHNKSSPTWRRYSGKITEEEMINVGDLKVNEYTMKYIEIMAKFAKILESSVVVVQTPSSFKPTKENISNAELFFDAFTRVLQRENAKAIIGWEPRGTWLKNPDSILQLISDNDHVIHVTDPMYHDPVKLSKTLYFRLHGKPYLNYRYKYTDGDFRLLIGKIRDFLDQGIKEIYVMFNNVNMINDAKTFQEFLNEL